MTVLLVLVAVGVGSWLYRVSFTALFAAERLPATLRARADAVTPAAFAALIACHLTSTEPASLLATFVALAAAGVAGWVAKSHLAAVIAAVGTWALVTSL